MPDFLDDVDWERMRRLGGRTLKFAGLGLAGLSAFAIVLVVLALLALQIGPVRSALGARVIALLGEGDGLTIEIDNYRGIWPVTFGADRIVVRDGGEVIAEIDGVDFSWAPFDLLSGTVHVTRLDVERVNLLALPAADENAAPSPPGPLIPSLPVAIEIDAMSLPQIDLAAGIAGTEPVLLAAEGHAALTGGRADLALKAQRRDGGNFNLDAVLAYAPDDETLAFDVTLVDGSADTPGLVAAIAGDRALGMLQVEAHGDGPVDDWRGNGDIKAGGYGTLTFSAAGDRRDGGALGIEARFVPGPAVSGAPDFVALGAQASRRDDSYTFDALTLTADDTQFDGHLTIDDPLGAAHLLLEGDLANAGALMGSRSVPPLLAIDLDVTGDETLSRFEVARATAMSGGQKISFEGAVDLEQGFGAGRAVVDVQDVAALAKLAGIDAAGPLTGQLEIERATFEGAVDASLDARFQPTALPDEKLLPLVGVDLLLTARVADAGDGATRIEQFELVPASGAFGMTVSGLVSPASADLEIDATASQLALFSAVAGTQLSGSGDIVLHLSGPFDALTADTKVTLSNARVEGIAVEGEATAKLKLAPVLKGPVAFKGMIAGSSADISLVIDGADGRTQVRDIVASLMDMQMRGGLTFAEGGVMTAQLDGDITSLAGLGRVAGTPMRGSGQFKLGSVPGAKGNRLVAEATLRRVDVDGVQVGNVTLRGSLAADERITARIQLRTLAVAHVSAGEAVIELSGTFQRLAIDMDVKNLGTFEDARGNGSLIVKTVYDAAASSLTIDALSGQFVTLPLALASPATIFFARGLEVRPLVLRIGKGEVEAAFTQATARMTVDVAARALPLRFLAAVAGESSVVRGTLDGMAALSVNGSKGTGTADFTASPRVSSDIDDIPDIAFVARWDGDIATVSITSDAPGTDDLAITASLPMRARGGRLDVPARAKLDARMLGNLDIGAFWPLVPVDQHRMLGVLALDVTALGPLDDLVIAGTARMTDGLYENFDTGLLVSSLNLALDATTSGGTLTVTGSDGATGRMTGSGVLDLRDEVEERLNVSLKLVSFRIAQRDEVHSTASGDIEVLWPRGPDGAPEPLTIGGKITVEKVDAIIPEQLASDVTVIEVTKVTSEGEPLEPDTREADNQSSADQPSGIELDLTVDVPRQAFVRGRGLDSEWMGDLVVKGSADTPDVRGTFQVVRGTFDFLGKTFDLTGGRIEFTGGREIDPYLNVKAVYEEDDFEAVVAVTGVASDPKIELSAVPALPQDEILARILFGTGTGQLSALQAVQLAQAAAELTGFSGGGGGVLDAMRRALGVDVLSLGDSGVEVGSYVREGVYVGVSQGLEAGSGQVSVEVELTSDISVESDVGAEGDTSVGVTWKRDY